MRMRLTHHLATIGVIGIGVVARAAPVTLLPRQMV